jgi:hydrogenase-4 component F
MARDVLAGFGVFSLLVGALFIVRQTGIKRLMAYSSVEHMGVIALGIAFGGILGTVGALYHMLNHSLNKSLMFFGAGNAMRSYRTKRISRIHAVGERFPVSGALWLAGAVAITGAPPFGLFLSEFIILRAGFQQSFAWASGAMLVLLIVIFIGFLNHFRSMYFASVPRPDASDETRVLSAWCITPMWLAATPLLLLGVWWPAQIWDHLVAATRSIGGGP